MSDSSEDEDLSRFKQAVDASFVKLIDESRGKVEQCVKTDRPSKRFLDVSSHYNDIKVPKAMQKVIGNKVSAIINNFVEYVDVEQKNVKRPKIKGGVKLFNDSEGFLSCKEENDTYTEVHNRIAKTMKRTKRKRIHDQDISEFNEIDRVKASVVSGEFVMSKEETRHWHSRRKEKLFTYKAAGKNKNILLAV